MSDPELRAVAPLPSGRSDAGPETQGMQHGGTSRCSDVGHSGPHCSDKEFIVTVTVRVAHALDRDDAHAAALAGAGEVVDVESEEVVR